MTNFYIIGTILLAGILGFGGALLIFWKQTLAERLSSALISFAAGTMLGAVFFDLLPESIEALSTRALPLTLLGILLFFLLEKVVILYHCHGSDHCEHHGLASSRPLILLGDTLHNFLDGVIIATAFLVSVPLGIVAAVAEIAHEIPQEIGDFSVLLKSGMRRKGVIFWNIISELGSLAGGVLVILFASRVGGAVSFLLPIATGGFLYIASADLIPELHHEVRLKHSIGHIISLFVGLALIWTIGQFLEA